MADKEVDISVIMSVYNTEKEYLDAAIESILNQTHDNFEFIIINDGSDGQCVSELEKYHDKRIVLLHNEENMGLTKSLNIALRCAKGKYIARMDSDDYSYPERLKCQYEYMERHREIDILGCWIREGTKVKKCCGSVKTKWRYARMLFDNVGIYHPTAFIRSSFLKKNQLYYDEDIKKAQDYELWTRCLPLGNMYVYPKVLFAYRIHDSQISKKEFCEQNKYRNVTRMRLLDKLRIDVTERELKQFHNMDEVILGVKEMSAFLDKIISANSKLQVFDPGILKYEIKTKWLKYISKLQKKTDALKSTRTICLFDIGYVIYMVYICWCKYDFTHHNRE